MSNELDIGKVFKVLIEGTSKKSDQHLQGRTSNNKVAVFEAQNKNKGEYVNVLITECTGGTLLGKIVA